MEKSFLRLVLILHFFSSIVSYLGMLFSIRLLWELTLCRSIYQSEYF